MNILEEEFGKFEGFEYRKRKPLNKLVEGIGINDAPFMVQPIISEKQIKHPAYQVWRDMLRRCFNTKVKDEQPAYINIICCEEWLSFSNFAKWFKDNYIKGYQLDKDLLVKNNLIYSPNTCIFVPQYINKFLTLRNNYRGELPIGVSMNNIRFQAQIGNSKGRRPLGTFDTPEQAHQAWQKAKLEQAIAFNFPPLQRVIDQLTYEIENNLETTSL